jgi:hypothetical protein
MDSKTGRLTSVTKAEVAPHFIKDSATGEFSLDTETSFANGFLYRFASAWGELFKAFSHKDTILHTLDPAEPKAEFYLSTFILDPGVVISWIDQYKASPKDRKNHISQFFNTKLTKYISQFPEDEQKQDNKYLGLFHVDSHFDANEDTKPPAEVLTPKEIGYLNPNVPRPKEKAAPPTFEAIDYIDSETGEVAFEYVEEEVNGVSPGTIVLSSTVDPRRATLLGLLFDRTTKKPDPNTVIVIDESGQTWKFMTFEEFKAIYNPELPPPPPPSSESGAPFAYDQVKAREYGFSELKVERHEKSQKIIDAVYARDPKYVTLHRVGTTDPDSTTTPKAILTVDKYKVNVDVLKQDWLSICPDLPNIPEKSMWYFQALADHRLSNTIDTDDPNNINNPTVPHIPKFGEDSFMLAMDFPEFDYDNPAEKQSALTPQTKKILKTLFNIEDPTNISRDDVNQALWINHERRIQSSKALSVIRELVPLGEDPNNFELRLMRYDEYTRAASSKGYGEKNLWTHFEGYFVRGGGNRYGLHGGRRAGGGSALVGLDARGYRSGSLAGRIVLSRRNK